MKMGAVCGGCCWKAMLRCFLCIGMMEDATEEVRRKKDKDAEREPFINPQHPNHMQTVTTYGATKDETTVTV